MIRALSRLFAAGALAGGLLVAGGIALPAMAQDAETAVSQADGLAQAPGAELRGLDKIAGQSVDLPIKKGQTIPFGTLLVSLRECRYPSDDPSSNAYAYLVIREKDGGKVDFEGWMIADSPALNALDHPRYDVWVMRCTNS